MISATTQSLPIQPWLAEKATILLVSPSPDDQAAFRRILHHPAWSIHHASGVRAAIQAVQRNSVAVVICEQQLPDGTWRDLLQQIRDLRSAPLLLVTAAQLDGELWNEVLNQGGYDVLVKPYDRTEVTRVICMAWRFWSNHSSGAKLKAVSAASRS